MADVIDPGEYGAGFQQDPHGVHERLRERGPVHRVCLRPTRTTRPGSSSDTRRPGPRSPTPACPRTAAVSAWSSSTSS